MSDLTDERQTKFQFASAFVNEGGPASTGGTYDPATSDDDLQLDVLYQQATSGDCEDDKPSGWFDRAGTRRWTAYDALRGMTENDAKDKFIALVESRYPGYLDWTPEKAVVVDASVPEYTGEVKAEWFDEFLALCADKTGWVETINKYEVIGFQKCLIASNPIKAHREEGIIHKPLDEVASFMLDKESRKQWDPLVGDIIDIEKINDNSTLTHFKTKTFSKVVWPRDSLVVTSNREESDGSRVFIAKSVTSDKVPVTRQYVRATSIVGGAKLESVNDGKATKLTQIRHADFAGWLPVELVNSMANYLSIIRMRKAMTGSSQPPQ